MKKRQYIKQIRNILVDSAMDCGGLGLKYTRMYGDPAIARTKISHDLAQTHTGILLDSNLAMREDAEDPNFKAFTIEFAALANSRKLNIPNKYSWSFFTAAHDLAIPFANSIQTYLYIQEFAYNVSTKCKAEEIPLTVISKVLLLARPPTLKSYQDLPERLFFRINREILYTRSRQMSTTKKRS